jgi:hypothetical protein
MELAFFVYLAGLVGKISFALFIILFLYGVGVFGYTVYVTADNTDSYRKKIPYQKRWAIGWLCLAMLSAFIPSEKTMWLILGAYGTQKAVQSEIGADIIEIINLKIKKELEAMKGEKK